MKGIVKFVCMSALLLTSSARFSRRRIDNLIVRVSPDTDINMVAEDPILNYGSGEIEDVWKINDFQAYSIAFKGRRASKEREDARKELEQNNHVVSVDEDTEVEVANWGLDRVNQVDLPLDKDEASSVYGGEGVDVYVIDTGIDVSHPEFEGRAFWDANYIDNDDRDVHGHGTHVAGISISKTFGVAKKSIAYAVKVLSNSGSGSFSSVLNGIQHAFNKAKERGRPSIVNLSLGAFSSSTLLDDAINEAAKEPTLQYVCAAGNSNFDTCRFTPAKAEQCIAVGSSNSRDIKSSYSNYGECMNIFSFGERIESTTPGGSTSVKSGTSMAAPQVAGILARILSEEETDQVDVATRILFETGLKDKVELPDSIRDTTDNLLSYLADVDSLPTNAPPTSPPSCNLSEQCKTEVIQYLQCV